MMGREKVVQIETPESAPQYELRVRRRGPTDIQYDIWQTPASATPQVTASRRVAGLRGRNLELVEHRVLKRLSQSGLLFRALAPMRNRDNMRAVTEGIEAMEGEEIAYWLGMAMHRKNPRRVLKALRVLLTEAKR